MGITKIMCSLGPHITEAIRTPAIQDLYVTESIRIPAIQDLIRRGIAVVNKTEGAKVVINRTKAVLNTETFKAILSKTTNVKRGISLLSKTEGAKRVRNITVIKPKPLYKKALSLIRLPFYVFK